MIGEVSIGGVYIPALVLLGLIAVVATVLLARLLSMLGLYRIVAYRPLVDVALFVLVLGALALFTAPLGLPA